MDCNETTDHHPPLFLASGIETTEVFRSYWKLAAERQKIFFKRFHGEPAPWSNDPILLQHKFTNAYRASDRVSQYLIKHVIHEGEQSSKEWFFRILLFKFFNSINTWEWLSCKLGGIHSDEFSFEAYDEVLTAAMETGRSIYSAAYIMPSGGMGSPYKRKHKMHLALLARMLAYDLPDKIAQAPDMRSVFWLLRQYPSIGDFLAYQYATDLNYSPLTNFSEMDFVCPGPGALDGIRKCFSDKGGYNDEDLIRIVADRQQEMFSQMGLEFQDLWGRPLQLIDCQNLFCEVDKYARVAHPEMNQLTGRTRIKHRFEASRELLLPWYPPKWGINNRIWGNREGGESNSTSWTIHLNPETKF
ncbi:nucleotide kinase domain-containing protein [Prosthecobacter dejongeii]|uniref:5-hmdU DNA kinase helical domain-containing protein n=1 Tax=Prosthecobacter dejongeii TaxID=48465 RepID=A0A7W8DNA6_9BACT|nr:nucleotide kinase domain-containing protein [Prosthecobacter dejongeii]MBB5036168.1 hypothetical protein [Prosthecobacter dejongeii]